MKEEGIPTKRKVRWGEEERSSRDHRREMEPPCSAGVDTSPSPFKTSCASFRSFNPGGDGGGEQQAEKKKKRKGKGKFIEVRSIQGKTYLLQEQNHVLVKRESRPKKAGEEKK